MRTVMIFIGVYCLSFLAAYTAAISLAQYFFLQEEFIAVLFALNILSLIAIVAFAIAYTLAGKVRVFGYVALGLVALTAFIMELPALAEGFARRSTNPGLVGSAADNAIMVTLLFPALVLLLVQWGLIRRRWLVTHRQDHRTALPWITITLACIVAMNPAGASFIGSAIKQSPTDWLAGLWAMVVTAALGVAVVLAVLEWYIRRRRLARHPLTP